MNALTINSMIMTATDKTASEGIFDVSDATSNEALTGRIEVRGNRSVVKVEDAHTSVDVKITAAQRKEIEAWIESQKEQPEIDPVDQILNEVDPDPVIDPELDPKSDSDGLPPLPPLPPLMPQQELSFETKLAIEAVAAIASMTRENLTTAGTDVLCTIDAAIKALAAVRATKRPAAQRQTRASNGPTCKEQIIDLLKSEHLTVAELTKKTGRYYSQVLAVVNALIKEGVASKTEKKICIPVDSF